MRPLYEITNEYQSLMAQIMEADEISDDMLADLHAVQGDIKEKAVNVAAFLKNLEVEADGIQKAIESMEDRARKVSRKMESLRDYLKHNLEACQMKEVKSPFFDIRIRLNPASVDIKDETAIPDGYWREISTRRVDKTLIARDLKSNILIPGAELVRHTRLEVR